MPITNVKAVGPDDLYTTNGKDVWKVNWICHAPSIELENLVTKEVKSGGEGGLFLEPFKKLVIQEDHR